jgi:hypothetical protein
MSLGGIAQPPPGTIRPPAGPVGPGGTTVPALLAASMTTLLASRAGASAVTVPAATPGVSVYSGPIGSSSYIVALDALMNVAADAGILRVTMTWSNEAGGVLLAQQAWNFAATTASPANQHCLVTGRGPVESVWLDVTASNYDATYPATLEFSVYQAARTVSRHDWRSVTNNDLTNFFTAPADDLPSLLLGQLSLQEIAPAQETIRLCGLYAGSAQLSFAQVGTTQPLNVEVVAPDPVLEVPVVLLYETTSASLNPMTIALPRCPVEVIVINNGEDSATIEWSLVALEVAS